MIVDFDEKKLSCGYIKEFIRVLNKKSSGDKKKKKDLQGELEDNRILP